jgi:hypothetical protein
VIWLWIYLAGIVVFMVPTARFLLDEMDHGDDREALIMSIVLGMCVVPFWPLYLPGYVVYRVLIRQENRK